MMDGPDVSLGKKGRPGCLAVSPPNPLPPPSPSAAPACPYRVLTFVCAGSLLEDVALSGGGAGVLTSRAGEPVA